MQWTELHVPREQCKNVVQVGGFFVLKGNNSLLKFHRINHNRCSNWIRMTVQIRPVYVNFCQLILTHSALGRVETARSIQI